MGDSIHLGIWKAVGNSGVLLKGSDIDSLTLRHPPRLQQRDGDSGDARHIQGETKLCGFKVRVGGIVIIVSVLSPTPVHPAGWHHLSSVQSSPQMTRSQSVLAW